MELRHLRYFVAVAEELSFRRAAERLFMAQPPLSQQIRQLETEIGTPLFDRTAKRVTLTPAGQAFLEDAKAVLARVDSAVARAARIGRGDEGRLRVGFASSTAFDVLPIVVRRFRERYPEVTLELTELLGQEQAEALRARRIDVGLSVQPEPAEGLRIEELAWVPVVVALPATHPLASRRGVALTELAHEPFVRFPRSSTTGFARFVAELFQEAGIAPPLVQATEELQTALGLVAAGLGFTVVPGSVRRLRREGLVFRPFTSSPKIRLGVAHREEDASPLIPRFVQVAREASENRKESTAPGDVPSGSRRPGDPPGRSESAAQKDLYPD